MTRDPQSYATSFGEHADAYERGRPTYPEAAVRWLTGDRPCRVLELGAGTGLLTRRLTAMGHLVTAVEPDPAMARVLVRSAPEAHAVIGTAEEIPAPSRSVDVVVVGQALHWFDAARAMPEIARVTRLNGTLALAWNFPDEGIPWVRRLVGIIGRGSADTDLLKPVIDAEWFGFIEEQTFRSWRTVTREPLLDLARSRSSYAAERETGRRQMLARVAELYDGYGRGADGLQLPYLTRCYRSAVRRQPLDLPARRPGSRRAGAGPVDPPADPPPDRAAGPGLPETAEQPPEDPGTLLIDFC